LAETLLIAGLGNPGKEYEHTRHNIGFIVVRRLGELLELKFSASSLTKGVMAQGKKDEKQFLLLMPQTFMNNSGIAIRDVMRKKDILPENILVITDDFQLPFGQLRFRPKGSGGGHNGLSSIIEHLGDNNFSRLRVGVGSPKGSTTDYVLGNFNKEETKALNGVVEAATEGCLVWFKEGINKAMEQFNKRKNDGK